MSEPLYFNSYSGRDAFLSNFYLCTVKLNNIKFPHAEGAFQYCKIEKPDRYDINDFTRLSPSEARQRGQRVKLRDNWESVKADMMLGVVRLKFAQNQDLMHKLLATGDRELVYLAPWDAYWGAPTNMLGQILMQVRTEGVLLERDEYEREGSTP